MNSSFIFNRVDVSIQPVRAQGGIQNDPTFSRMYIVLQSTLNFQPTWVLTPFLFQVFLRLLVPTICASLELPVHLPIAKYYVIIDNSNSSRGLA